MTFNPKHIGFWLGLAMFAGHMLIPIDPSRPAVNAMAAVAALMAVWWITEAIPIPITALLPVALFPLLRIMPAGKVSELYFNTYIFLFTGGFLIALAMQKCNLHRRLALTIIMLIGSQPRRIILGFMMATGFISMWISNTATAMMMLPIGMSVIEVIRLRAREKDANGEEGGGGARRAKFLTNFELLLMLAIAYGASIGGVATLIGTPPNIILTKVYAIEFPDLPPVTFAQWMMMGVVMSVSFLLIAWAVLTFVVFPVGKQSFFSGRDVIRGELEKMGPMSSAQWRVLVIFMATIVLWITRGEVKISINNEAHIFPGWSAPIGLGKWVDDGTIAMTMALLLFLMPSGMKRGEKLIDWDTAIKLPWGILLLFGGGFALAGGFESSGLSLWVGERLNGLAGTSPLVMAGAICTMVTFLTELTSNTATTNIILPLVAAMARVVDVPPLLLMIPATLSASFAFMLPVATPPNAIVYGSGCVPIHKMALAGLILNLIGIVLTLVVVFLMAGPVFGIGK